MVVEGLEDLLKCANYSKGQREAHKAKRFPDATAYLICHISVWSQF